MKETLNNNLAELTKAVDKAILDIDEMETTIEEESARLDARLEGDGTTDIYDAIYQDGVEDGKKSEYDAFWDALQDYGNLPNYDYTFMSPAWNDDNFKPKYDIQARSQTFSNRSDPLRACGVTDLRPSTIGVNIEWKLVQDFNYIFRGVPLKYVGVIDMTTATSGWCVLMGKAYIEYVEKLILPPKSSNIAFKHLGFLEMFSLKEIRFEGFFYGSVEIKYSTKLSHDSIVSTVDALAPDITGMMLTLHLDAVNKAFETSQGANDGSTSEEWLTLVAAHTNWTISLYG